MIEQFHVKSMFNRPRQHHEDWMKKSPMRREASLRRNHPDTLGAVGNLGILLMATDRLEDAIPLLEEVHRAQGASVPLRAYRPYLLDARIRAADPAKPDDIARIVELVQELLADAEPLLLDGHRGMKEREASIPPQGATCIPEAIDRLIALYTAMGKPDEVKRWRAERARHPAAGAEGDGR